jgi:hypothetical protein
MEPKKRSVGASERDEFLRAAWRALVVGSLEANRLVFVDEAWAPTPRGLLCMPGRGEGSEHSSRYRETGAPTLPCWPA